MSVKAWNDEQEAELIKMYTEDDIKDVYKLASHFSKGYRSVISKLVQLKIYEKPEINDADKSQTVKIMLRDLEEILDIRVDGTNLNKKENLAKLLDAIKKEDKVIQERHERFMRRRFIEEEIQDLEKQIEPHDTGHIHTTISTLKHQYKTLTGYEYGEHPNMTTVEAPLPNSKIYESPDGGKTVYERPFGAHIQSVL